MSGSRLEIIGAIMAISIISICILIFIFRLYNMPKAEHYLGLLLMLSIIPLGYMLVTAGKFDRPTIYYIQLFAIIAFLVMELLLDYVFKVQFRQTNWMVITYVMIFFAGTGGLIGIASLAGRGWMISTAILFLIMAFLAFFQRVKTGM